MGIYAVTGSASGIGAATAARLAADGHRVIGIDVADADVRADLATAAGRRVAVDGVLAACEGRLDGLVAAAGIGGLTTTSGGRLISVNYFGVVTVVDGLRDALAAVDDGAVVVLGSNSTLIQPSWSAELARACLAGDEPRAVELAEAMTSVQSYPAGKAALAWWVAGTAPRPEWAGAGTRINAVAPGLIDTALTAAQRLDPVLGAALAAYPTPSGRPGRAEEVAEVIGWLLGPSSALVNGATIVADGGTSGLLRPTDWPAPWHPA